RLLLHYFAGVAELADAQDLKSCDERSSYRFDSGPRHHHFNRAPIAQLDRVLDYVSSGYRFDSYWAHHFNMHIIINTGSGSVWYRTWFVNKVSWFLILITHLFLCLGV